MLIPLGHSHVFSLNTTIYEKDSFCCGRMTRVTRAVLSKTLRLLELTSNQRDSRRSRVCTLLGLHTCSFIFQRLSTFVPPYLHSCESMALDSRHSPFLLGWHGSDGNTTPQMYIFFEDLFGSLNNLPKKLLVHSLPYIVLLISRVTMSYGLVLIDGVFLLATDGGQLFF